jgi:hypothetical protein
MQIVAYIIVWIVQVVLGTVLPPLFDWLRRAVCGSFYFFCGIAIARWITPIGHRRFGDCKRSDGYALLAGENYGIKPDWAGNAISRLESVDRKAKKSDLTALNLK